MKITLLAIFCLTLLFCKKEQEDLSLLTSEEIIHICNPPTYCQDTSVSCDIFKVIEQMPRFFSEECENMNAYHTTKKKCADEKMLQFLKDNVVYPKIAIDNNIEGEVVIQVVVEKQTGCLSHIKIVRDIGYNCGIEVQKVISTMPDFIVGRQVGTPVHVQLNIPYTFEL